METHVKNIDLQLLISTLESSDKSQLKELFLDWHAADIAEFFQKLNLAQQTQCIDLLENEISAQVLLELDEDERKQILETFSAQEIADEIINEIDSDDAADVISELSESKKEEVFASLDGQDEHTQSIVDLLKYDEDTAGGIMAKELVKVNENWTVLRAVSAMRKQAEDLDEVYSIYVVDENGKLTGTLSLKKLLTSSTKTKVLEVYNNKVNSIKVSEDKEDVARYFQKYDLYELPVTDQIGVLIGRITVDDVLDVMKEEAEKDYQMASGISQDVDIEDSLLDLTKARLPWLLIGMFGGLAGSRILQFNFSAMEKIPMLIFFVPLIAATAGNVGVQSSAIVVQGLANGNIKESANWKNLKKELLLSIISGLALSLVIFIYNLFINAEQPYLVPLTISIGLLAVVIFAALIGTAVPLLLEKRGIDPAIATGPFITTSNDIFGILIYFLIAKLILGI